jgi:hypothetical protein
MKLTISQVKVLGMLAEEDDDHFILTKPKGTSVITVHAWSHDDEGSVCLMQTDIFPDGTLSSERD